MKELTKSAVTEAKIAMGGPVLGSLRMTFAVLYFGLVAILGFGMAAIYHGMI